MQIFEVTERPVLLIQQLLQVWESAVKKTHLFLSDSEIEEIKKYVPQALEHISHLIIAENEHKIPIAFMGVEQHKLEMLFVSSEDIGKGLGKRLLQYGIKHYSINELTVNEQNISAKGFYEHMGFRTYKRTDYDEQGNPYPLLYMKRNG